MEDKKDTKSSTRFSQELERRLKEGAEALGTPKSALVRDILELHLDAHLLKKLAEKNTKAHALLKQLREKGGG